MIRVWYLIWAVAVWQVANWTFLPTLTIPVLTVNVGKAYGSNEVYAVEGRAKQRQDAFRALEKPLSLLCTAEGHKQFVDGLGHYFYHRQNQIERYPETFGQLGADYIAKQYKTSDDLRIDRLTREQYANGYLKVADFNSVARKMVVSVVEKERVSGRGCDALLPTPN